MKLIAVETASEACSAALLLDGEVIERFEIAPRQHTQLILPMVDLLLADAGLKLSDLDGLAFSRGPGAFTGVRIATGVIQGLAFAADLPVVPVSTLAAMAKRQYRQGGQQHILTAIDARMGEIYWAGYHFSDSGEMSESVAEQVVPSDNAQLPESESWFGVGSGWQSDGETLIERLGDLLNGYDATLLPHAADIALLASPVIERGEGVSAANALPIYLRDQVAHKS
ncbi:MAG: tRNA (adenosine(37)-N6)-threonylcarbamoyltransferase complex dimerization subunit type 1 TsaB [Gammaproteobacteria bacterium]|nr:tRNA (adenosine(37)-N6)-threonylcarbamoyltransferase complex dimerization subunit type 1 TsaB [Gammaproteobacteria bacterium]